jgi:hypothetical protein
VTPETIGLALGRTASDAEYDQWAMWVGDALMLIDARKAALSVVAPLDAARVDYVVREAVVAHVRRPDDATQVTVSVDDSSTSKTYRSSRGRITILDEWWALLGLTGPRAAYAIDAAPAAVSAHLPWCALTLGAAYCSCGADIAGEPIYEGGWE